MPLYEFKCETCKSIKETIQYGEIKSPECCGSKMQRLYSAPMIKMWGMFPSRKKWMDSWTPESGKFNSSLGQYHGAPYERLTQ